MTLNLQKTYVEKLPFYVWGLLRVINTILPTRVLTSLTVWCAHTEWAVRLEAYLEEVYHDTEGFILDGGFSFLPPTYHEVNSFPLPCLWSIASAMSSAIL